MRWYITVVLDYISLMVDDVENRFVYYWPFVFFGGLSIQVDTHDFA